MSEPRQRYTVSPKKPTKPPAGPAPTPPPGPTINNEPLSTKQLHELITSQAMTIDRLLGEVGECRAKNKHVCEWTGKYKHYHEITGDTLFRVRKTSCSDDHDDIVSVVDYTFCPNCGGQIKYIEET